MTKYLLAMIFALSSTAAIAVPLPHLPEPTPIPATTVAPSWQYTDRLGHHHGPAYSRAPRELWPWSVPSHDIIGPSCGDEFQPVCKFSDGQAKENAASKTWPGDMILD